MSDGSMSEEDKREVFNNVVLNAINNSKNKEILLNLIEKKKNKFDKSLISGDNIRKYY